MDLYKASLASLVIANAGLGYLQYKSGKHANRSSSSVELHCVDVDNGKETLLESSDDVKAAWNFKLTFLSVYGLVMGADWLQVRRCPYQTWAKPFDMQADPGFKGTVSVCLVQG